jgi:transposase-like protein
MSAHSVPLHCPYCAGENLHPHGERHGAWECRECLRAFSVSFIGLLAPTTRPQPPGSAVGATDPARTGGVR